MTTRWVVGSAFLGLVLGFAAIGAPKVSAGVAGIGVLWLLTVSARRRQPDRMTADWWKRRGAELRVGHADVPLRWSIQRDLAAARKRGAK